MADPETYRPSDLRKLLAEKLGAKPEEVSWSKVCDAFPGLKRGTFGGWISGDRVPDRSQPLVREAVRKFRLGSGDSDTHNNNHQQMDRGAFLREFGGVRFREGMEIVAPDESIARMTDSKWSLFLRSVQEMGFRFGERARAPAPALAPITPRRGRGRQK